MPDQQAPKYGQSTVEFKRSPTHQYKRKPLQFRGKPVMIEAVEITAADYNGSTWDGSPFTAVPDWLKNALGTGEIKIAPSDTDYAMWLVAEKVVGPGFWIVRNAMGDIYAVDDQIFREIYEAVNPK